MRSIWRGSISLGLINIPVQLLPAVETRELDLHLVRRRDLCPINYARVCRGTGEEVPYSEIARSYKLRKNQFVILDDQDFEAANVTKYNSIVILGFALEDEIERIYFEKPYFISPQEDFERAYYLLAEVLRQTKKLAIAKFVLRNRERLAAISFLDNRLVLFQLRFAQEIKKPEFEVPSFKLDRKEIDLARALVESLSQPFKIENFRDTYTDELMEIVERKSKGKKITVKKPKAHPSDSADLVNALSDSLKQSGSRKN